MATRNRLRLHDRNGAKVIDLGTMEIWGGTDLALLRETLTKLIDEERHHSIGVNLESVKYIPSGFFGLLFDWREKGIRIQLFNPQPHVQRMLWFQQFLEPVAAGCFLLLSEPTQQYASNFLFDSGEENEDGKLVFAIDGDELIAVPPSIG